MTRYARMKRDQRIQEANSTPWSVLANQAKKGIPNISGNDEASQETKKNKLEQEMSKEVPNRATVDNGQDGIVENVMENKADVVNSEDSNKLMKKKKKKVRVSKKGEKAVCGGSSEKVSSKKKKKLTGANCVMGSQELLKLKEELFAVEKLNEAKQRVRQLWRDGKLERSQAAWLIRKWRSHRWREDFNQNREKIINSISSRLDSTEEQTLDDVRQMVNRYVASGKITHEDAGSLIRKWKKRESRRIKRQLDKGSKACCFYCRQSGHNFSECPEKDEMMGSGICFKCGSTEHTSSRCHRKNVRGFPYATCFVCKQQGHLSRDCERNANGIYPDGGSCNLCGSQKHLKKDCPLRISGNDRVHKKPAVATMKDATGGDDDVCYDETAVATSMTEKSRSLERKVVRI